MGRLYVGMLLCMVSSLVISGQSASKYTLCQENNNVTINPGSCGEIQHIHKDENIICKLTLSGFGNRHTVSLPGISLQNQQQAVYPKIFINNATYSVTGTSSDNTVMLRYISQLVFETKANQANFSFSFFTAGK